MFSFSGEFSKKITNFVESSAIYFNFFIFVYLFFYYWKQLKENIFWLSSVDDNLLNN